MTSRLRVRVHASARSRALVRAVVVVCGLVCASPLPSLTHTPTVTHHSHALCLGLRARRLRLDLLGHRRGSRLVRGERVRARREVGLRACVGYRFAGLQDARLGAWD
jgi:hypothetical protein